MKDFRLFGKTLAYRYVVAAIYSCVLFLDRLDLTIVNITLPTLAEYFNVPITKTEWITNSFLLALAISIPISSWLGDKFGDKKVFIIATFIFGLSSLLCAFSPHIWAMVVLRFIQGIGGGIIIPVGMTMVYRAFDKEEYASITSFVFLPTLIAPALAPSLGGFIIHFFNWQWVFLFAVPICLVAVILSWFLLENDPQIETQSLDWLGFILAAASLVTMLSFISLLGSSGLSLKTLAFLLLTLTFLFLFVRQEKISAHPLLDLSFFKYPLFLRANFIQVAFQICHFGSIFLVGMYLQVGIGMSALVSGFVMGMQAVGAMFTSRFSVKLYNRYGPKVPIIIGFIGVAIFTTCILLVNTPNMVVLGSLILFIRGIFSGLCGTPIQTASIIEFNKKDISQANAIFNAGRQVSISLGVALSSLMIAIGFNASGVSLDATLVGQKVFYYAFMLIPIISLIGIIITTTIHTHTKITPHRLTEVEESFAD